MAAGKHMGKILIDMQFDATVGRPSIDHVIRRTICHPRHSYLVTGGLGGLGLETAKWLAARGATKLVEKLITTDNVPQMINFDRLVLTSRSGVKNGYQKRMLQLLRNNGVQVCSARRAYKC